MKIQTLGILAALACAGGITFPHTARATGPDGGPPPPPWVSGSSGNPILSGSGGPPPPWVSGSGAPILSGSGGPPPPWVSGSGAPILSGSGGPPPPPPPFTTGSGGPIVSGSGGPPPWAGGTGGLPGGSLESLTIRVAFTSESGTSTTANGVLHAVSVSGADRGTLDIHTTGLSVGTYTVSAVTDSGATPVTLGTFDVKAPRTTGTSTPPPPHGRTNTQFGGPRGIAFPDGVDPFDIASLAISDSNANLLFTADLTTVADGAFDAITPIESGTTVTGITGVAQIHAHAKGGVVSGVLLLNASGLPGSTTYTYAVNGANIGAVTTGTGGALKLAATENPTDGTLPDTVNLFTVTSVTILDGSGDVILSATF
jgi:hypothetical protein